MSSSIIKEDPERKRCADRPDCPTVAREDLGIKTHRLETSVQSKKLAGRVSLALVVFVSQAGMPANAATPATGTFDVNMTVQATCSLSASSLPFGIYTGAALSATATLSVTCTNTTYYYINVGDGLHYGGDWYPRMIGPGGAFVGYRLYQDSAHSIEWRNTQNVDGQAGAGNGAIQLLTIYGLVAPGQLYAPGAYTDTLVVTLNY